MSIQTAQDVKANYKEKLGNDFGELYYHAHNEWANVKIVWQQYQNLFGHGQERVDLLNISGAGFFVRVEQSFLETVIMGICRLSDPKETGKNKNLSVQGFLDYMPDANIKAEIKLMLDEVEKTAGTPRKWRHKRFAHNDLDLLTGTVPPLPSTSRKEISEVIDSLFAVFSYISVNLMDTTLSAEITPSVINELNMINVLYDGIEAHKERSKNRTLLDGTKRTQRPKWLSV